MSFVTRPHSDFADVHAGFELEFDEESDVGDGARREVERLLSFLLRYVSLRHEGHVLGDQLALDHLQVHTREVCTCTVSTRSSVE